MSGFTLITGANGFVGRALCAEMLQREYAIRGAVRNQATADLLTCPAVTVGEIDGNTDWITALDGVETIVHLAARVHIMKDTAIDPLAEFRRVNVDGTEHLAQCAAAQGVKRLIYLSSIKVNGEETFPGHPYTADDIPAPVDPYGISKFEAEQRLRQCALETGLEVVIIRPALVYGPGVKGNFQTMMRWLCKGVPLPLCAIDNKRSFVALDNLVDLIITCLYHPKAANQTFLVSDGEDVSTTELLHRVAAVLGRPTRLIPMPGSMLNATLHLLGKSNIAQRLCSSLQVDIEKTRVQLGWAPLTSVEDALSNTVRDFQESRVL